MFDFLTHFLKEKDKSKSKSISKSKSKKENKLIYVNKDIILLKQSNIIIYYNIKLKYPSIVIELFNNKPQNSGIKRSTMGEPFQPNPEIPLIYQHTIEDYINYGKYGGSYGHNAAAFIHKDAEINYKYTYLFTNISPQEVVFNAGLWLLFEGVSEKIIKSYGNGIIINGNIKGKDKVFNGSKMNIPSYMYKIIIYEKNNKNYYICFVAKNKAYYLDEDIKKYKNQNYDLSKYNMDLNKFQNKFGLKLLSKSLNLEKSNEDYILADKNRITQIQNATLYGSIIYAKNENELNKVAPNFDKLPIFHKIYYNYKKEYFSKNKKEEIIEKLLNKSMSNPIF